MGEETGSGTKMTEEHVQLARISKALSHPVRIYILDLLSKQSCCYSGDLAEELPVARSTLSQHLKELKRARLIQGSIHPPRIMYCLNEETWNEVKSYYKKFFQM